MRLNKLSQAISLILAASTSVQSAEFIVQTTGDSGGGAAQSIGGDRFEIDTLRSAIEQADNETDFPGPDVIRFDPAILNGGQAIIGLFLIGDTYSRFGDSSNSAFGINSEITISGPSEGALTWGSCGLRHLQVNDGGRLTLERLTLTDGLAPNNSAGNGGAILVTGDASVHLSEVTIANSQASNGGALFIRTTAAIEASTVSNSVFSGNDATGQVGSGGAINLYLGALQVHASTLSGNSSNYSGGAIASTADLTVVASTIDSNEARRRGGGISTNNLGFLTLLNSTISGNSCKVTGGGIHLGTDSGDVNAVNTIINSTITGNHADTDGNPSLLRQARGGDALPTSGGGLHTNISDTVTTLHNTLISDNVDTAAQIPDDIAAIVTSESSHNLFSVADSVQGVSHGINGNLIGTRISPIAALLGPLSDNGGPTFTHTLQPTSPAVNAGNDTEASNQGLLTDQRGPGFDRFIATVDMGAIEFNNSIFENGFEPASTPPDRSVGGPLISGSIRTPGDVLPTGCR